ncbi:MAG TPA: response regulator [Alphaproteobacteria bacterium]
MPDSPLAGHRVFLAEDEMLVSMLVEDVITGLGCELVGPAASRDKALALAAAEQLDAALLDVNLGGEPVYPVADLLKARGVPFAFITGYGNGGISPRYAAVRTLTKPFPLATVEHTISELIREKSGT